MRFKLALLSLAILLPRLSNASPVHPPVPGEAENPLYASNSSDDVYWSTATNGLDNADIFGTQGTDSTVSNAFIDQFPGTVFVAESTATVTVIREVPVWTDAGGQRSDPSYNTLLSAPATSLLPETTHGIPVQNTQQFVQAAAADPPTVTVTAIQVSTTTDTVTVQTTVVSTATTTETQTVTYQQQQQAQQPNIQMIMNQPSPNTATVTVTATITEQAMPAAPQYIPQYMVPQPQPIVVVVPQAAGQMNYYPQQVGNYPANNIQVDVQQSLPTPTPAPAPYPSQTRDGPTSSAPLPPQLQAAQTMSSSAAEPPVSSGQSESSWVTVVETLDTTIFTTVTLGSSEQMPLEFTSTS
ncbi:hypothetical protein IWW48_005420 [Coemansia sp. RSA 1200]|nr:hypothetical protein IWW48_005420 [Coemansia sp. RSA 1200]